MTSEELEILSSEIVTRYESLEAQYHDWLKDGRPETGWVEEAEGMLQEIQILRNKVRTMRSEFLVSILDGLLNIEKFCRTTLRD